MDLISSLFTIFAAFVLPIVAAVWLALKKKRYLRPVLFGALTFIVFQVLTRIPLLQLVIAPMPWYILMSISSPLLAGLFLSLTAALFEEVGRYIVMRLFLKNNRRYMDSVAFGIGHGGTEAILLVGLNALIGLIMSYGLSADPWMTVAAGVERLSAMVLHVALSVMVLQSINKRNVLYLILAIFLHTLTNLAAVMMQANGTPVFLIEAVLFGFALIMLIFVIKLKNRTEVDTE
ncbi:MAG: hypothetical protein BWY11_01540 [Firmicutes bacterium ADurb.Bin182]|nr:MAG: hypothetical protein BWY11_01540 [Firmicutes bacterium ADurb.Bin182]